LYDVFVRKFLIGAVARAFNPGCKLDTVLVFQGRQGQKKSTFFEVLGGAWFDDSLGPLDGKDDLMTLHRSWIMEWSEFDQVIGQRQASQIKSFLSRRVDRFRPPYGRMVREYPRRGVICGSTNQPEFLNDPTGSRRFWVIPTGTARIDTALLQRERDGIWAAAVQAYKDGEQWWLDYDLEQESEQLNCDYQQTDPWQDVIAGKLSLPGADQLTKVTTEYILTEWIGLPKDRQGKPEQRRVGAIMRALGWESKAFNEGSHKKRVWVKVLKTSDPSDPVLQEKRNIRDSSNVPAGSDVPVNGSDAEPIRSSFGSDAPVIRSGFSPIRSGTKPPPGASSSNGGSDGSDDPANFTPAQKFQPGDLVRYTGNESEILRLWPEPVRVVSVTGGVMLTLPVAGGKTDTVGIWGWELVP
uniref:virulence-associated E family protein n=1 Tax=Gloeomargarita lithophora TaxID=1188228 RepID=UPI003F6F991F